ncbi:TetR/AcrR family transcriptional regulator [Blastococcus sp. SYSU D00922]
MPRVTEEHRLARREQILDAATATFAAEGFQATGMAELIAASGLSAGAVYRYFAGKDQIIEAIVDRVLDEVAGRIEHLFAEEAPLDPARAVELVVTTAAAVAERGPVDVSRLAVQAWGEALRNPAVAKVADRAYGRLRALFAAELQREKEEGRLPSTLDVPAAAAAMLSLVLGFVLQRLLLEDVDPRTYSAAVAALLRPGSR